MPLYYLVPFKFHPAELTQEEKDRRIIISMVVRIVVTFLVLTCCAIPLAISLGAR